MGAAPIRAKTHPQAPVMVPKLQLGLLKGFSKPFKLFCCRLEAFLEPLDGVLDTFD